MQRHVSAVARVLRPGSLSAAIRQRSLPYNGTTSEICATVACADTKETSRPGQLVAFFRLNRSPILIPILINQLECPGSGFGGQHVP